MKNTFKTLLIAISLLYFTSAGFAADASVSIENFQFNPATTSIAPNDRVIWTWNSGSTQHSTTSTTSLWNSGLHPSPFSFTNTFTTPGSYSYICSLHTFMTGSVTVTAPSQPPAVSISSPTNGTILSAPANVVIQATASDTDGTVTNVQFLAGTSTVTNDSTAPFTAATNNLPAGNYTLTAVATDNSGLKATNSVNISVVTPVPLTLGSLQWLPPAGFQFSYSANIGLRYVIQRSSDLTSPGWTSLITNTATNDPMSFMDLNAPDGTGFYRVGRLPNP